MPTATKKPKLSLEALVAKHENLKLSFGEESNTFGPKIINTVSKHEIKATEEELLRYINTKDYKKSLEKWYDDVEFEKYLPHIVPHKGNPKKLVCLLTKKKLNKIPVEVEKHVNGKNFKKKLLEKQEFEAKQKEKKLKKEEEHGMEEEDEEEEENDEEMLQDESEDESG